jgi:hypothetical protein
MNVEYSRPLRLGRGASGASEETLLAQLEGSRVSITVDPGVEQYATTAEILIDTLRRLPVGLGIDADCLERDVVQRLMERAAAIDPSRPLDTCGSGRGGLRVHVGGGAREADLYGVPIRHGARVGTRGGVGTATASGLGVFTCGALLAGEVFKRIAAVLPERATFPVQLQWCPVTLGSDLTLAPELDGEIKLELALVGLGAIGTAITRILSLLEISGNAAVVDPEPFAPENLGTYSLGTAADAKSRPWKTSLAVEALPQMSVTPHNMKAEDFIDAVDRKETPWPRLVLSGLDSAEARREVQRLWPNRLIDGATGDTMCGLHDVRYGSGACLICHFPKRAQGQSASARLAAATGLPEKLLRKGDRLLSESDLESLSTGQRKQLAPQVGKPICGLAEAIGLSALDDGGYRPSVPFVSQQAACLVAGRLLAHVLDLKPQPTFVQYDALIGPGGITIEDRQRSEGCYCAQRAELIDAIRAQRDK